MEGVRVEGVGLLVPQKIFGPDLEGGQWEMEVDELHYHHGELEDVLGSEVHGFPCKNPVDGLLEVSRLDQGDEVADLVQAIGGVEGS
jgi:hypothetical protein